MMKHLFYTLSLLCLFAGNAGAQAYLINTIAGNDTQGYSGDNGAAIDAQLYGPDQLCMDKRGNLLIVDEYNNRIRKIDQSTGIITTIAGTGFNSFSGDGGPAVDAEIWQPQAVRMDTAGNIYIADALNNRVRKITMPSGIISTIAGNGSTGNTGDGGPATNATFYGITGIYIDVSGDVLITDGDNNNIRKVSATTGIISTIAGSGVAGYSGDGGPATAAKLNLPFDIFNDSHGNIIFTDAGNNVIRKIDTAGTIHTIAGTGAAGHFGDGGPATAARFSEPTGLFIDAHNNIFTAEFNSGYIRRIDGTTGIISTLAGNGFPGFSGDGGLATEASLYPEGLWVDNSGVIFVADFNNNRIRKIYSTTGVPAVSNNTLASIALSPNPARDVFTVNNATGTELNIYDATGKDLYHTAITSDQQQVNINGLPDGVYLVKCTDGQGACITKQLVKAR